MSQGLIPRGSGGMSGVDMSPVQIPLRDRLVSERKVHSEKVEQIDRALKLLERNPDIEELMNIL